MLVPVSTPKKILRTAPSCQLQQLGLKFYIALTVWHLLCVLSESDNPAAHNRGEWEVVHTPADADEHPLAQLVGGVGKDNGSVEVAAFTKHPKEIGGVEIIKGGGDEAAPNLQRERVHYGYSFTVGFYQANAYHISVCVYTIMFRGGGLTCHVICFHCDALIIYSTCVRKKRSPSNSYKNLTINLNRSIQ